MTQDRVVLQRAFALCLFTGQLAGAANGLGLFTGFLDRRLLEMLLELHFAEDTFALKFLLQSTERLFDVVVANIDLHVVVTTFLG
ncbi:hypothetical protein TW83_01230 [Paracoccus sp. S4493]|nr:hypothetical protein TW83_01230 [Paracoccus sp. S4493]